VSEGEGSQRERGATRPGRSALAPAGPAGDRKLRGALIRYRVMAYVVGVWLVLLVLVAMPLKYFADSPTMVEIVGPVHGFLYMAYLATAVDLAFRVRWSAVKTVLVMLAGTVPFVSFYAERKVTAELAATVS
jgi:integral membrane protein